jgi:hypothetical protein
MKKALILYILLIAFSLLMADTIRDNEIINSGEKSPHLNQCYYTGLLRASIEFSQEEYAVGDTIDVTIHFNINAEQNTENRKYAVTDYKNKALYAVCQPYDRITKGVIESQKKEFAQSTAICKFIKCDPDLILSNENPTGDYHITFKLTKKCPVILAFNKLHPYVFRSLKILEFTEAIPYPYITDYKLGNGSRDIELTIPIKLHPSARDYERPSGPLREPSGKPKRQLPTKQTPVKIGRGGRETLQVVHAYIFHV